MSPSVWISLAGLVVTLAGWAVTWGATRQKVADLEVRVAKSEATIETKDAVRQSDREAVIRLEEQMRHLQATLDRMDDKLTQALREKRAPSRRASA